MRVRFEAFDRLRLTDRSRSRVKVKVSLTGLRQAQPDNVDCRTIRMTEFEVEVTERL
jgi:hypothetical protein